MNSESTQGRNAILNSIREHLFASTLHDAIHNEMGAASDLPPHSAKPDSGPSRQTISSLVDLFRERLEAVDGHCLIVENETAMVAALRKVLTSLETSKRRVALSDARVIQGLAKQLEPDIDELAVAPEASSLFGFDVGITGAQAAIAETGTLVLQSDCERNRLLSLLPPVHIAIIKASQLCLTLGEALAALQRNGRELSPAITFITGPSRTADIELTLAIGVHGPQQLFVIINTQPAF